MRFICEMKSGRIAETLLLRRYHASHVVAVWELGLVVTGSVVGQVTSVSFFQGAAAHRIVGRSTLQPSCGLAEAEDVELDVIARGPRLHAGRGDARGIADENRPGWRMAATPASRMVSMSAAWLLISSESSLPVHATSAARIRAHGLPASHSVTCTTIAPVAANLPNGEFRSRPLLRGRWR